MIMLIMLMIIVLLYLVRSLPEKTALLFLADPGSTLWPLTFLQKSRATKGDHGFGFPLCRYGCNQFFQLQK